MCPFFCIGLYLPLLYRTRYSLSGTITMVKYWFKLRSTTENIPISTTILQECRIANSAMEKCNPMNKRLVSESQPL